MSFKLLRPWVLELLRVQRCWSSSISFNQLKQFKQFNQFNQFRSISFFDIIVFNYFRFTSGLYLILSQVSSRSLSPAGSGDIIDRTWMTYIFWYEVYLGLTATNPCYFGRYIKGRYTSTNGWSISFRWMITLGDN